MARAVIRRRLASVTSKKRYNENMDGLRLGGSTPGTPGTKVHCSREGLCISSFFFGGEFNLFTNLYFDGGGRGEGEG